MGVPAAEESAAEVLLVEVFGMKELQMEEVHAEALVGALVVVSIVEV